MSDDDNEDPLSRGLWPEAMLAVGFISPQRVTQFEEYLNRVHGRRQRRVRQFADSLARQGGRSIEQLVDRIMEDEQLGRAFESALHAASESPDDDKRQALAAAVALAIQADDQRVTELAQVLINVLEQLEAFHVRVLRCLAKYHRPRRRWVSSGRRRSDYRTREVARYLEAPIPLTDSALNFLRSLGLIQHASVDPLMPDRFDDKWRIASLGVTACRLLEGGLEEVIQDYDS